MDKLTRLFVHRLRHLARREARRIALRNGLLEGKIVDVGGHLLFRYAPVFDISRLSGDPVRDGAWLRQNFGDWLVASKETGKHTSAAAGDGVVTTQTFAAPFASPLVAFHRV